jgi:hypothetical protein
MKYPVGTILLFKLRNSLRRVDGFDGTDYTITVLDDNSSSEIGSRQEAEQAFLEGINYRVAEEYVVDKVLEKYLTKEII